MPNLLHAVVELRIHASHFVSGEIFGWPEGKVTGHLAMMTIITTIIIAAIHDSDNHYHYLVSSFLLLRLLRFLASLVTSSTSPIIIFGIIRLNHTKTLP